METHKRLVSILHIIYGTLSVLIFLIISAIIRSIFPFILEEAMQQGEEVGFAIAGAVLEVLRWIFILVMILGPIPSIIGGIATLYNKSWGLPTLMVSGCLGLLNIPIGTALGIYTIWVFLEEQKLKKAE
ncbi:MAG: hypothetical protein ACFHWX_04330 [Bacteroidota bacterium]